MFPHASLGTSLQRPYSAPSVPTNNQAKHPASLAWGHSTERQIRRKACVFTRVPRRVPTASLQRPYSVPSVPTKTKRNAQRRQRGDIRHGCGYVQLRRLPGNAVRCWMLVWRTAPWDITRRKERQLVVGGVVKSMGWRRRRVGWRSNGAGWPGTGAAMLNRPQLLPRKCTQPRDSRQSPDMA